MENKRLYRTENGNKLLCGVCGGIAEYFDIDPTLVRLGWAVATISTFSLGFWAYLAFALLLPRRSDVYPS